MSDDEDFLKALQTEAASLVSMPSENSIGRLNAMGRQVVALRKKIDAWEAEINRLKGRLYELITCDMPDLMSELNTDVIGLSEENVDLVLAQIIHANIKAEWPEEQREAAFAHLEEKGLGDIIKNTVTVTFGRDHYDELQEWLEKVRGLNLPFDPPEIVIAKTVPWNTLTATVKEQLRRGTALDLEKLGATVGQIVNIKPRTN